MMSVKAAVDNLRVLLKNRCVAMCTIFRDWII